MYFTDEDVVKKSQADFASYAPKFPGWAENAQGILQATIWTAFTAEGLSGTLQHYHPLMDEAVRKEWNIPETWSTSLSLLGRADSEAILLNLLNSFLGSGAIWSHVRCVHVLGEAQVGLG